MPVSLQQFFNSANTVGDSASLFLQNGGESVGDTSSLHGIHKLSRSAKAEENRATVTAFLNALDQSPQFRNINADIRGMLNAKLEGGKPLTAEDVKLVRDSVLYDEALAAGRQLADGNALPAGHATSFAQFALVRNLDLGSPQGQRDAVRTYLCEKVIPQNVGVLTQLPGLGTRGAAMTTASPSRAPTASLPTSCGPIWKPTGPKAPLPGSRRPSATPMRRTSISCHR